MFSVAGVNLTDFIPSINGVSTFFAVDILGAIGSTGLRSSLGVLAGLRVDRPGSAAPTGAIGLIAN